MPPSKIIAAGYRRRRAFASLAHRVELHRVDDRGPASSATSISQNAARRRISPSVSASMSPKCTKCTFGRSRNCPPRRQVVVMRPERPAVGFPVEPALADPARPQLAGSAGQRGNSGPGRSASLNSRYTKSVYDAVVVPQRHEHVARVAPDDDVLRLGEEAQAVGREVALDEPPMRLRLDRLDHRLDRPLEASVDPRREVHQVGSRGVRPEHERGEDALRPGGPRLVRGRDDDVVVAHVEAVPARAVEVMVAVLVQSLRCRSRHFASVERRPNGGHGARCAKCERRCETASLRPTPILLGLSTLFAEPPVRSRWS